MSIVLGVPTLDSGVGRLTYRVDVDGFPGLRSLWFSVPDEAASLVNTRADAALVALLMPAMAAGRDIVVEGPITDELAWSLHGEVQDVLRRLRPELSRVDIEVRDPLPALLGAAGVATGYSAGVDSYATLARHRFAVDVPESLRVTHLLYNNVGSHGHGDAGRALYRNRLELLRPNALTTGLPLTDVDSNIDEFYLAVRLGFQQSHTMRNAGVVHLLSGGIRHYFYASSVPWGDTAVAATYDLAFAEPVLLPLLSTRSLSLRSSCSDIDRVAKTALIAEISHTYERLDVCVESTDGTNCSECWKCQRTMLTLELLGVLDRYHAVFTTPRNPYWRENLIVYLLTQPGPTARHVVELYDDRVGIPLRLRAQAQGRRAGRAATRFAGRASRYAKRVAGVLRR
ncbi:hypothetical protein [Agromyces humatus]|uniref:Uncharacterized protein n=1 Tax=Agromyces humatus TaxID=279573 RepID=A0ABN2KPR5_9MICO|nr:hypothetical protein [Agromyces humatus]